MIRSLLSPGIQDFIRQHEQEDEKQLVLRHKEINGVPTALIAAQIIGRRKAKDKLPTYYQTENILYPPGINLEQSSSEQTAQYKSIILTQTLFQHSPSTAGGIMVDLTGGFGIDSFSLSKLFKNLCYVEPDLPLLEITKHNHQQLGAANISYYNTTAEQFLNQLNHTVDLIYIDPSRRLKGNQKVFKLSDCEPDVISLQPQIFEKTNYLLIKTSPLLDIQQGLKELKNTKKVFVISVHNECKEVLFLCEKDFQQEPDITAINITKEKTDQYTFTISEEKGLEINFSAPLKYLYEPNASILKAGAFKTPTTKFNLLKLHPSTHLYTSDQYLKDFPGRIFEVETLIRSNPGSAAETFPDGKANIITRNYPLGTEELKKKLKLKDGGEKYLIGLTTMNDKILLSANRLK